MRKPGFNVCFSIWVSNFVVLPVGAHEEAGEALVLMRTRTAHELRASTVRGLYRLHAVYT
jgi:hypothetical protein